MVAGFDPQWKDPAIVYLMANGRKFLEFNTGDVNIIAYSSEDGLSLYYQTGTTFTFYVRE